MATLPTPGGSNGTWGTELNTWLTTANAVVNVKLDPYNAAGDGSTNDTSAINAAIAAVPTGGTLLFPRGRYMTNGGHTISTPMRIMGPTGRGQTFNQSAQLYLRNSANATMLTITSPDVVIRDLSLYGNETNQSSTSRGIATSTGGTNNYLLFDSVWVDSFNGDGFYFESSGGTLSGTVVNCESRLNDGFGMTFTGTSTDMIVSNCYIDQNVQSGVDCAAGDIAFTSCHIWGNGTGGSGDRDGITFHSSFGCRVENCYIESQQASGAHGIRFKTGNNQGHIITGCDIWANNRNGINAFSADNCIISNNVIRENNFASQAGSAGAGLAIDTCTGMTIVGNSFFDPGTLRQTYGYYEVGSSNVDIRFSDNTSRGADHATGGVFLGVGTRADLGSVFVYKTGDQSVTSSTTLVDDTHLQFAVAAGEIWELEGVLFVDAAQTGDLNVRLATPGSPTGYWQAFGARASATSTTAETIVPTGLLFDVSVTLGALGAGVIAPVQLHGLYTVGTAGTFKVRWAQGTSDGTATILKAGSYLRARRIAQ